MKKLHIGSVAGVSSALRDFEISKGIKSDVLSVHANPYQYDVDYVFKIGKISMGSMINTIKYFILALNYDVLHYHVRPLFKHNNLDIWLLKFIFKKRILIHYHGSDLRLGREKIITYADRVFVSTLDLLKFLPSAEYIPNPIYISNIKVENEKYSLHSPIRILHTPTDSSIKGTIYINNAVEKLKTDGYDIEYMLSVDKNHDDNLKLIQRCDIYIDQILLGVYGVSSIESMFFGKPTLCYINQKYPGNLPIVNVNSNNLYNELKTLIDSLTTNLEQISESSKKYAIEHHCNQRLLL